MAYVSAVGYDWRHDTSTILSEASFTDRLARKVEEAGRPVVIAAHGYRAEDSVRELKELWAIDR